MKLLPLSQRSTSTAAISLVLLGLAGSTHAAPASEVTLHREAPFDAWCVAPLCRQPTAHSSYLNVPAAIAPDATQGLIEQQLRQGLANAIERTAQGALGPAYNTAVADLADALIAVAAGDATRLAKAGGLGASVLRAGLVYRLDAALPASPSCAAPDRLSAIYEGLAVSAALAPLEFPQRSGRVSAACADTARSASRTVDQAVLYAVTPEPLRRAAHQAATTLAEAQRACAAGSPLDATPSVLRGNKVGEIARSLRTLQSAADLPADSPCNKAINAVRAIPADPFDALGRQGLADATIAALDGALGQAQSEVAALIARIGSGAGTPDDLRALAQAIVNGIQAGENAPVLRDALAALVPAVTVGPRGVTVDPKVVLAALAERYGLGEDGTPSIKSLLGLGITPWVFELNGGVPKLNFADAKVVGDLSLGYATGSYGLIARGWVNTYDLSDNRAINDYLHSGGQVDGYWMSKAVAGKLRLELRLSASGEYYDTTTTSTLKGGPKAFDFDSRMVRGSLLAGARYGTPVDRVSGQLLVGGGGQFEAPDTTRIGAKGVSLQSNQSVSGQASGRLAMRVRIVPNILGARLRGDARYYRITRDEMSVNGGSGTKTVTTNTERQRQLELHGRLFLDADVASVAGFVPSIFGGFDYLSIAGSATTTTQFIPLLGVGITRQTW